MHVNVLSVGCFYPDHRQRFTRRRGIVVERSAQCWFLLELRSPKLIIRYVHVMITALHSLSVPVIEFWKLVDISYVVTKLAEYFWTHGVTV